MALPATRGAASLRPFGARRARSEAAAGSRKGTTANLSSRGQKKRAAPPAVAMGEPADSWEGDAAMEEPPGAVAAAEAPEAPKPAPSSKLNVSAASFSFSPSASSFSPGGASGAPAPAPPPAAAAAAPPPPPAAAPPDPPAGRASADEQRPPGARRRAAGTRAAATHAATRAHAPRASSSATLPAPHAHSRVDMAQALGLARRVCTEEALAEATQAMRTVGTSEKKKKEEVPLEEDTDERCVTRAAARGQRRLQFCCLRVRGRVCACLCVRVCASRCAWLGVGGGSCGAAPAPQRAALPPLRTRRRAAPRRAARGACGAASHVKPLPPPPRRARSLALRRRFATRSEHVNIVFIGHVDAGKSTIGGQILFLTARARARTRRALASLPLFTHTRPLAPLADACRARALLMRPQGSVDERLIQKYEREAKEKNRESWYMVRPQRTLAMTRMRMRMRTRMHARAGAACAGAMPRRAAREGGVRARACGAPRAAVGGGAGGAPLRFAPKPRLRVHVHTRTRALSLTHAALRPSRPAAQAYIMDTNEEERAKGKTVEARTHTCAPPPPLSRCAFAPPSFPHMHPLPFSRAGWPRALRDGEEAVHHPGRARPQKLRAQHDCRRRAG
jgi:hypothetical protein